MKSHKMKFLAILLWLTFFPVNALATPTRSHKGACYHFQTGILQNAEPCILTTASGAGVWGVTLNWQNGDRTNVIRLLSGSPGQSIFKWIVENKAANTYNRDLSNLPLALQYSHPTTVTCHHIEGGQDTFCYQFMHD